MIVQLLSWAQVRLHHGLAPGIHTSASADNVPHGSLASLFSLT